MKIRVKFLLALVLSLLLIMTTAGSVLAGPQGVIDYVAIGDSGAAGVRAMLGQPPGWEDGSDYGYTDNIARWLHLCGVLGKFNEDYSISGNTAAELAVQTSTKNAQKVLSKAEIVTITIGANDLLGPLYDYYYGNIASGTSFDLSTALGVIGGILNDPNILEKIGGIQTNVQSVLTNTFDANPDAKVYIMKYYNPLPFIKEYDTNLDFAINGVVSLINSAIEGAVYATASDPDYSGVVIRTIDTMDIINGDSSSYAYGAIYDYTNSTFGYKYLYVNLLQPIADIHLTMRGYLKVAEAFITEINKDFDLPH